MKVRQTKTCSKCGETKELEFFYKKRRGKFGVQAVCKACDAAAAKEHYAANRERRAARQKAWHAANRERVVVYQREYTRTRRQTDPQYRLASLLRRRLNHALRNKAKRGSAVKDLGMPVESFLAILNEQALACYGVPYTGNESKFHIDHIRPLASFNLEDPEQLRIAVRWDNLQVLLAAENMTKGARY